MKILCLATTINASDGNFGDQNESFRRFTITKLLELGAVVVIELGKEEKPLHEKEKS